MSTVRALAPIAAVLLVLGTGLGILAALVPVVGWVLVLVFGGVGGALIAADVVDTYRRSRPDESEAS